MLQDRSRAASRLHQDMPQPSSESDLRVDISDKSAIGRGSESETCSSASQTTSGKYIPCIWITPVIANVTSNNYYAVSRVPAPVLKI